MRRHTPCLLFILFLAVSLIATAPYSCGLSHTFRPEAVLHNSDARVKDAWSTAKKLGGVDPSWNEHPPVLVVRAINIDTDGRRILGRYLSYIDVDAHGHIISVEQVLVYVLPYEDAKIPSILVHEFLHAIWQRRTVDSSFKAENPDSEAWVCGLSSCND